MTTVDVMFSVANGISKGMSGYEFCFCLEEEKFYIYKNGYWKPLADLEIMALILEAYSGNNGLLDITRFSISKRRQILENLKQLIFKRLEVFNKTGYLNFDLGEFDPTNGTMHSHNKDNYSTLRFNYPYHASAKCDLWLKTLNEIFEDDQDKISVLQEFFGYCLTRDVRKEKALLLLGESRSGKSTILETLGAVMGEDNTSYVSMCDISNPQYTPLLMNKLVNIDTDVSAKAENYEREFKTIVSGEPMTCNQKFVETFRFRPYCKLAMGANVFPPIKDHSSAFFNRLILLPCDRVFDIHEQDLLLKDKLTNELSGIFNWSVEGLRRLNDRGGFEQKEFMLEAVEELRIESNPTEQFFRDYVMVQVGDGVFLDRTELYEKYKAWSQQNNHGFLSSTRFNKAVFTKYCRVTDKNIQDRKSGRRIWRNLAYKNQVVSREDTTWQD